MVKEGMEDKARHDADHRVNNTLVLAYNNQSWRPTRWKELHVGDIVQVLENEFFPADMVLLHTSDATGSLLVDTTNLDGESTLKVRRPQHHYHHDRMRSSPRL
jgi:phospholipid-transporting ATPase